MARNKNMTKDSAFEKCRKKANDVYKQKLIGLILEANTSLKDNEVRVIYLDKNHPPNE